ncbi:MAG: cytochrome c3 family protein [Thermodesulfobacteriota bacterium]|nr:cytochrome c3 family protein [Thermodesulfobacteriota bacterium]
MYRSLTLICVLLLFALTACDNGEAPQVTHEASLSKALTRNKIEAPAIKVIKCPFTNAECNPVQEKQPAANELKRPNAVATRSTAEPTMTTLEPATTSILTLSLQNRYGAVLVPHSLHVEMYNCDICHTTNPPSKINKTKKEFHALCRNCHIDLQCDPIKCRDCHKR